MNPSRHTWALSALALTLVLGACSTPDDLTAPMLEPQFGTADNDFGVDVTAPANGSIFILQQADFNGTYIDEWGDEEGYYGRDVDLTRYDKNGNYISSQNVAYDYCTSANWVCETSIPVTVFSDAKSYVYVLYSRDDGSGETYYYVSKHDPTGKLLRQVQVGSGDPSLGLDAAVDSSGNLYVAASVYQGSSSVGVVAKYSYSGSLLWQRTSTVGTPKSISLSSNGNVYVGGLTGVAKYTNSGNLVWTKSGAANDVVAVGTGTVYVRYNTAVRKLDANGKQLWSKTQTGLSGMVVGDMTTDGSANVYLTGKYSASSSNRDVFTRKLNSGGTTVFTKMFGTSAYDDARGITTLNGSEIYITGASQGSLAQPFQGGDNDGYIRKLNSAGSPIWTR